MGSVKSLTTVGQKLLTFQYETLYYNDMFMLQLLSMDLYEHE